MINLGDQISKHRIIKNIKQSDLAHRVGVTVQTMSKWERGLTEPTFTKFLKVCSVLDIPQELFLSDYKKLRAQRLIAETASTLQECIFNVDDEITIRLIESTLSELVLISKRI